MGMKELRAELNEEMSPILSIDLAVNDRNGAMHGVCESVLLVEQGARPDLGLGPRGPASLPERACVALRLLRSWGLPGLQARPAIDANRRDTHGHDSLDLGPRPTSAQSPRDAGIPQATRSLGMVRNIGLVNSPCGQE